MKFRPGVVPQCPSRRGFDVLELERLAKERIVEQVDLPDGKIVRRAPVRVHAAEFVVG